MIKAGLVTPEQLDIALNLKKTSSQKLGDLLVELGYLTREQVVEHLYKQLSERINLVLKPMAESELAMAAYYAACAKSFEGQREFWLDLEADELRHAATISEMIDITYRKPDLFKPGRVFSPPAIKTFRDGIVSATERVLEGQVNESDAMYIAKDIENASIEARFFEALSSEDKQFNAFVKRITAEDRVHSERLRKAVSGLPPK